MTSLKTAYLGLLKSNQRTIGNFFYTVPSSMTYPYQWFWDSCFHSIIYTQLGQTEKAKKEIYSLLESQWADGMIPHMNYWGKPARKKEEWGTPGTTSSIIQPPMIAYAAEKIYAKTQDRQFLNSVFPVLDKYHKWLHASRSEENLITIIHPWESGQDNLISWASVYGITKNPAKQDLMAHKKRILREYVKTGLSSREFIAKNIFSVKCLLFNSVYLKNLDSMQHLSKKVDAKKARYYSRLIPKVRRSFRKNLFNSETGLYTSYYTNKRGEKTFTAHAENSSIFMPLFAGILTKKEAKELVEKYLADTEKFWPAYPVPTLSKSDPLFRPDKYWQGSTWININWFIHKGLINYGMNDLANELRKKTYSLVKMSGFHEYFNPLNGKGHGPDDFTWSGLIFEM